MPVAQQGFGIDGLDLLTVTASIDLEQRIVALV
jgi:hypothetical protein